MFMRIDKLQIELPKNVEPDPAAAAAIQELLGGRFGEMSTLNNYMFQSFNMRGRDKIRPFYELVASITAEEFGHVELVSATINLLLNNSTDGKRTNPDKAPLSSALEPDVKNLHHLLINGNSARAADAMDMPWTGNNVFNSGDIVLDTLHNFFLESGARAHKMRCYETTDNPVARRMIGYLLVRGGVHQAAYARALEELTGVSVTKMLPIPQISNKLFDETREFEAMGLHRVLYRFSPEDYTHLGAIWHGEHYEDGLPLEVREGTPEGGPLADLTEAPSSGVPGFAPEELAELSQRIMRNL